ncbi:ATP-binding protein [Roseinatronobacter sp. NSM]|uniref:ATP-binding protein n=1 Tax=Roseinatronobacter sp. NSM TaxID=3457785 RepID=UPI0040359E5B
MADEIELYGNAARLTDIQGLVVDLINRLLSTNIDEIDHAIDDALAKIGAFTGRDRAYVFVRHGDTADNTHEWCATGVEPMKDALQGISMDEFQTVRDLLDRGEAANISDVRDYPETSDARVFLEAQGIRSMLLVPMVPDGELFGVVGFDSVSHVGFFSSSEIYLLRSFADVVTSVLLRRDSALAVRAAQDELARERAFLQGIVSTSATGFVVLSSEGRIIYANDAAETVLGASRDFMLGEMYNSPKWDMTDLNGATVREEDEPFVIVQKTGRMVQNHRVALNCADGVRYASFNAAPIATAEGQAARVVYAVTDVTALVTAEQAREAALDEARRANVAKSNFLAKMSHEIRTPLNGILGIADILSDTIKDQTSLQMINVLRNSGTLLMGIINDLLDMSKIEADALELESVPFLLSDLARRTEEVHTLRAAEKGLSFSVRIEDPGNARRLGDPQRLTQILHNLISNSVKFTQQGYVNVWLTALDDAMIRICVEDSGIGMTQPQLERVFAPFSQADSSISRRFGGTGLGMSIVKRLVEMMEGTIELASVEGQGTKITVNLPLRVSTMDDPVAPPGPALGAGGAEQAPLPRLSILVADDNRTNQMILGIMLGQVGAQATMADDGLSALELFRQGKFDVLVLDISMPGMDGVTLLNAIRTEERLRGLARTPALAFTANAMSHQVAAYRAAGFDDCLTKPLKRDDLVRALSRLVGTA